MAFYRGEGGAGTGNIEVQPIAIGVGGTGATTSAQARTNLGLGTAAIANTGDFATAAQGALADSAVQPGDLAAVATSGDYDDLSNKPSLFSGDYDDLTNKPVLTNGTVTSIAATVPTGLTVSGSPITSSGTLAISYDTGYSIPTTAKQTEWDTAYGWGNHASAGYLTSETYTGTVTSVAATVPTGLVVSGSPITSSGTLAFSFDTGYSIPTTSSQSNWDTAYGWGDHASAGYLTSYTETDPVVGAINGLVKANGSGTISAAVADTDYLTPSSIISGGTY